MSTNGKFKDEFKKKVMVDFLRVFSGRNIP